MTRKPAPPVEPSEDELKERVIHTRVPESLETELRRRAQDLGISVSNLVRNVLGHAFGLVGDVVSDGASIARAARGERGKAPPPAPALDEVVAWQPIVLAKNAVCARCNAVLRKGGPAAIAVGEHPRAIVCSACMEDLADDDRRP